MGLAKGQTHKGQFQKGDDPRRMTAIKFKNGEVFRKACREKTEDALQLLDEAMRDTEQPMNLRVSVARYILEQAHGKPVSSVALKIEDAEPIDTLTLSQLDVMIARFLKDERDITPQVEAIEHCT
jgi:hypothetical protein